MYRVLRDRLPADIVNLICELSVTEADCRRYRENKSYMLRDLDNNYDEEFENCQNANWIEYCTHCRFVNFVKLCKFHLPVMMVANDFDYATITDDREMWMHYYVGMRSLTRMMSPEMSPRAINSFFTYRNLHNVLEFV